MPVSTLKVLKRKSDWNESIYESTRLFATTVTLLKNLVFLVIHIIEKPEN